mmetsp:Transcript_10537/g.14544  ORF Transcript_10537/g.14544 Transcript_10537/m.14544 type:complete len:415 (+) Transcript_10537:379-1623(+)
MATINICGVTPVEDPSYRYKMPKILGKVEGRGNGIKTVLVNVADIGLSLNREAPEITKFFGCELGSQTTFAGDRAIVNGAHRDMDLQTHLFKYIELFVLCKKCRLPETHYKIKDGLISQKCLACGNKDGVDMTHKLTAFILAQHKKAKELTKNDKKEKDKKDKKDVKKSGDAEASVSKEDSEKKSSSSSAAVTAASTSTKEKKEKKATTITKAAEVPLGENVFGVVEAEEDDSDSKVAEEGMVRFKVWLTDNPSATTTMMLDELRSIQTMASLRPGDRIIIYLGSVFSDKIITEKEIPTHRGMLAASAPSEPQQRQLIAAFEWFCGVKYPSLLRFFPMILKLLLDEELVEEDVFFAWAGDLTRNDFTAEQSLIDIDTLDALKTSAAPFIKWLQEAEEEGDEEEDEEGEDDDDEV